MKILYAIAGFVIGIMTGLLLGLAEMKLTRHFQLQAFLPFAIGITVVACVIAGIITGIKMANKKLNSH